MVTLFIRLEKLEITAKNKDVQAIILSLLSNTHNQGNHLCLLCIPSVYAKHKDELIPMIDEKRLLDDYMIKFVILIGKVVPLMSRFKTFTRKIY
jgi:hypothetical protein